MGRPTKLTPDTQKKIEQAIQLGATYELAAQFGGISYGCFNEWMKRGLAEIERADKATKNTEYAEIEQSFVKFYEAIKEAEGKAVIGWLAKIEVAATDGNWQAAAWKLERRYPREYGRQALDVDLTSAGKPIPIPIAITKMDMDEL